MFNHHDRIVQFVNMIMAEDEDERRQALAELEPLQRSDFKAILKEMKGLPVTIRLLDPPPCMSFCQRKKILCKKYLS